MPDLIQLTPPDGAYVTAAGVDPKAQVIDALGYERMDLVLTALKLSGTLLVRVETAVSSNAYVWQSLGVFTPLVAGLTTDRRRFKGVLRFVRWKVETLTGDGAIFTVEGTVS